MGRNSKWNTASKSPELQPTKTCFPPPLPNPIFYCFWPSHLREAPFSASQRLWQSLHSEPWFVAIYALFSRRKFSSIWKLFSLEMCYFSPSLKLGSKSIVWIHRTPCSVCPRCSQTLSVLSWLQHYKPLHISYWFLGIHSFTLTGSPHMSTLSYTVYTFKQCFI